MPLLLAAAVLALQDVSPARVLGPSAPAVGIRVVCVGDGTAAPRPGLAAPYAERLEALLGARGIAAEVELAARRGDTSVDALRRLDRDVLGRDPDVVVVQLGRGDALVDVGAGDTRPPVDPTAFGANLAALVDALDEAVVAAILLTPSPAVWTKELRERYGDRAHPGSPYDEDDPWGLDACAGAYVQRVVELAARRGLPLVDVHGGLRARGAAGAAAWLPDGLHPGDEAHAWTSERLAREVARLGLEPTPIADRTAPSRGTSLVTLDLAGDASRVIEVDREPGQYLGHPSTVLLGDGRTILCAYPKGHGRGAIVLKSSPDGGRTWSDRLPVPESWATSKEVPTLHRLIGPDGAARLLLWSGLHPARLALSEDEGATWSELAPAGDWGGIVVMGDLLPLADGRHAAWFHDDGRFLDGDGRRSRFDVLQVESADGGRTWSDPRVVAHRPRVHLCEPGAVRSPDGGTLALLLRENSRTRNSHVVFSTDEGATWSEPRELPGALTGDRHQAVYTPDGRLFVSFRDTGLDSPTWGDWCAWVGTWEDLAAGHEGAYRVRLMDNHVRADCAYPALEALADGTIVCTTYGHWTPGEPPWIACLRLRVDELDRLVGAAGR